MKPKLVIFDCDGTIVDSAHVIHEGFVHTYGKHDLPIPSPADSRSIIGLSLDPAFAKLSPALGAEQRAQMVEDYKTYVIGQRESGETEELLYSGAEEMILSLAAQDHVLLGIATGKAYRGVLHMFNSHGWHDHFQTVQTADRAPSKPHPGMILQAMEETGVAAEDTVMIGDTSYDMEMAVNAGVTAIGVTWGYHSEDVLRGSGAHHMVSDYAALDRLLSEML